MATIEYPDTRSDKTKGKLIKLKRPIVKLCKLPIERSSPLPAEADGGEDVPNLVLPSENVTIPRV